MNNRFFIWTFCVLACLSSCQPKDCDVTVKVHFDIRQCSGDEFGDALGYSPAESEIINVVGDWLIEKGIIWENIDVDMMFHEAVCEACYVCPTGERLFVRIESSDFEKIKNLNLLNFDTE